MKTTGNKEVKIEVPTDNFSYMEDGVGVGVTVKDNQDGIAITLYESGEVYSAVNVPTRQLFDALYDLIKHNCKTFPAKEA